MTALTLIVKWPVYIFTFGEINSRQINDGGIQIFFAQFQTLKLRKEMLNAVNIYLFGIKRCTKCKYLDTSFVPEVLFSILLTKQKRCKFSLKVHNISNKYVYKYELIIHFWKKHLNLMIWKEKQDYKKI